LEAADFGVGPFELLALLVIQLGQRVDSSLEALGASQRGSKADLERPLSGRCRAGRRCLAREPADSGHQASKIGPKSGE